MKNLIILTLGVLYYQLSIAQNLNTISPCPSGEASYGIDWNSPAGTGEFDWPDGALSYTANNVNNTDVDISFTWTGETGTLTTLGGIQTPNVASTLAGGVNAVELVTNGFSGQGMTLTMTLDPPIAGSVGFEIYHMNRASFGGAGDQYTISATTSEGQVLYPTFTANGNPSWTETAPGVVDANASSTAGQNDQVGVSFNTNEYISTITMIWQDCSTCGSNNYHGAAFGNFNFCLDDLDMDGVANQFDIDSDNDGITDDDENCGSNGTGGTLDWDTENWTSGSSSDSFTVNRVTIDGLISSDGSALSTINETSTFKGGTGEKSLRLKVNQASKYSSVKTVWAFSTPVDSLSFSVFDVDINSNKYIDSLTIIGFSLGTQVYPTLTAGSANTVNGNAALGTAASSSASSDGNVGVDFSTAIDSVIIYWGNGMATKSNPNQQNIGIYDFSWKGACGNNDFDGDGVINAYDLDSDNDGIIDNIEAQTSIGYLAPLGIDSDGDGLDDQYDPDSGGTSIVLSNSDSQENPDYLDIDSDEDGNLDWIEGFDDNGNSDALDDLKSRTENFENGQGFPMYYVNSNDADSDGIPDWAEDDDNDEIPNFLDADHSLFFDTDNDGLIDLFDPDNGGVLSSMPDFDGDGVSDYRDPDNQISLPIELLHFKAIKERNRVRLEWETAAEFNNNYFTVERSNSGSDFKVILQEAGAGNSNKHNSYLRYDENPNEGYNYYRLVQTDYDGQFKKFHVVAIQFENRSLGISIYPNPNRGSDINLQINNSSKGEYKLEMRTLEGRLVGTEMIYVDNELGVFRKPIFNGLNLNKGTYLLQLSNGETQETVRLVVY